MIRKDGHMGEGTVIGTRRGGEVNVRHDSFEHYLPDDEAERYNFPFGVDSHAVRESNLEFAPEPNEVNPTHYSGDLVMRVIEERGLDFALGNTVKYVCRAGSKGDKLTDLKKALWYLERAIAKEESAK